MSSLIRADILSALMNINSVGLSKEPSSNLLGSNLFMEYISRVFYGWYFLDIMIY